MDIQPSDYIDISTVPANKREKVKGLVEDTIRRFYDQEFTTGNVVAVICKDMRPDEKEEVYSTIINEVVILAKTNKIEVIVKGKSGRSGVYRNIKQSESQEKPALPLKATDEEGHF